MLAETGFGHPDETGRSLAIEFGRRYARYARYIRYITDRRTAHVPGHAGFAGACRVRRGMPGHAGAYRGVPSLRYRVPCPA